MEPKGIAMRINVYSQEITSTAELISRISNVGVTYHAVRLILHSSSLLHHPPADDDRSAVTLWLPKSKKRREQFAATLEEMARLIRSAPQGTGLD